MPIVLDSALTELKTEYTFNEKLWFFGPFASMPQHFTFPPGELKTLFALVRYVKQVVDQPDECEGLHHFANATIIEGKGLSYEENMVRSVFGLVFGCLREKKLSKQAESLVEKRMDLFKKACTIFEQFENEVNEDEILPIQHFTLELVDVNFVDQKWKGKVRCIFCKENNISGDISVYLRPPAYWVLANISKHIKKYHTDSNKENQPKKRCFQTLKLKIDPVEDDEKADDETDEATNSTESASNSTKDLSSVSIEDTLYGQLSSQCIRITNCTLGNMDKVQMKNFGLGPASSKEKRAVKYVRMNANGDRFFLSVAHQLFNVKAGSKQHEERALELRKSVVTYIKQVENFPNFQFDLKNRIKYGKNVEDSKITEMCADFLKHLSKPGIWAGTESFRAICEMENANLMVINEDGMGYLPANFNPKANKSLLLLFTSPNGKSCKNNADRSHYDSVVAIHKDKISEIAKKISEEEIFHDEFVKAAANRSTVSID